MQAGVTLYQTPYQTKGVKMLLYAGESHLPHHPLPGGDLHRRTLSKGIIEAEKLHC